MKWPLYHQLSQIEKPAASKSFARVRWAEGRPLTLLVQSRDQRATRVLTVHDGTGRTDLVREDRDEPWVEIVDGVPDWSEEGR